MCGAAQLVHAAHHGNHFQARRAQRLVKRGGVAPKSWRMGRHCARLRVLREPARRPPRLLLPFAPPRDGRCAYAHARAHAQEVRLSESFGSILPELWTLWELVMLGPSARLRR